MKPRFVHGNSLNAPPVRWGGRTQKDVFAIYLFRARDTFVSGKREAQRQFHCMFDADAARDEHARDAECIVADLQRRIGIEQIEAVVGFAGDAEGLAQTARAAGEVARRRVWRQAATAGHLFDPRQRLERTQEDATSQTFFLAGKIHAVIAAVDEVDIRVTRRAEQDFVPRRWPAMRMRGGIGCRGVGAEVGFDFDYTAGEPSGTSAVREDFAEQSRGYVLGRGLEKGTLE